MASQRPGILLLLLVAALATAGALTGWNLRHSSAPVPQAGAALPGKDLLRATYDPLHFKPAIESATDEQCLTCHREVLDDRVRETSPAGVRADNSKAWYQHLGTYQGKQDSFHRRHMISPLAQTLMKLHCNTCHLGHDPRDEAPGTSATGVPSDETAFTLRKQVNVEQTCLKCHGQMDISVMGLPGPWLKTRGMFGNSCLTCHAAIRTERHQVNYLNAEAIEAAGAADSDACFGCHGGRAWYRLAYPYPRHAWPGMPAEIPAWASKRAHESEARFRLPSSQP